jgi:primosomal protein N' (replication factor Y)
MGRMVSVIISNATREFDKEYHYFVPGKFENQVKPGVRVIVPFGKADRSREAYVFGFVENTEINGLKEIKRVIDDSPVLDEKLINLAIWMKKRYICTYHDAIKCMLPAGIGVKSFKVVTLLGKSDKLGENCQRVIFALAENGNSCEFNELKKQTGLRNFSRIIKELEKLGLISIHEEYTARVSEKTVRAAFLCMPVEEIIEEIENSRIKRIQHIRVLEMLMENEYISTADIVRFAGVSASVLDTLKKYGYIDFKDVEVNRDPIKNRVIVKTEPLKPTAQQEAAIRMIKEKLDTGRFSENLLHGVTGSGKTEVYLQLIQHVIEKGKQAIMLVPEISLTPQMVERMSSRFGRDVAVIHSRLSLGERYDQWRLIKKGGVKIVVGARSAVFAPLNNLGIIIIDEEHENSYKSEITPKYHAAHIAKKRCIDENAVLLYGSATPSIETYTKAIRGEIGFIELKERVNRRAMPEVHIVDMRRELDEGNRSIFSRCLAEEINKNIKLGQQTMLFLNRRGYASFVLCRACGYTLKCVNCSISLTYHSYDQRLICHYCGFTIRVPDACPKCKSRYIRHFGVGTQRVEEDVKKQFPTSSVIRMDMDTTTAKNSHEQILRTFREENINIMIGTQMIAKGHDFPNVTLVGVIAADSLLNTGDYRASERTFQLITQVAGRAGRGEIAGRVIIQTYNTDDFSILTACKHDYASFYKQEILLREKLDYPPFTNIAVIILNGTNDKLTLQKAKVVKGRLAAGFKKAGVKATILGPARSPLSKIRNKYRWRIIIKCALMDMLIDVLTIVSDGYYKKRDKDGVELNVDINPVNML